VSRWILILKRTQLLDLLLTPSATALPQVEEDWQPYGEKHKERQRILQEFPWVAPSRPQPSQRNPEQPLRHSESPSRTLGVEAPSSC
jgi:hypothetical protein